MRKAIRFEVALTLILSLSGAVCFAQSSGQAIYKAKCQDCHGPNGMANTKMAMALKVKPITDPEVMKISEAEMIADARNGVAGKMPAYKGKLSDAEIRDVVAVFRSFMK
jgi:mono/diheme cytochrome c family protein